MSTTCGWPWLMCWGSKAYPKILGLRLGWCSSCSEVAENMLILFEFLFLSVCISCGVYKKRDWVYILKWSIDVPFSCFSYTWVVPHWYCLLNYYFYLTNISWNTRNCHDVSIYVVIFLFLFYYYNVLNILEIWLLWQ